MEILTRDVCGEPATIHLCEISHGKKTERHLCAEHAPEAGLPEVKVLVAGQLMVNGVACATAEEAATRGVLDNLRGTRNFLREYGRMPRQPEDLVQGMSLPDDGPAARIKDAALAREFARMDRTVRFIQAHGRIPRTAGEIESTWSK